MVVHALIELLKRFPDNYDVMMDLNKQASPIERIEESSMGRKVILKSGI